MDIFSKDTQKLLKIINAYKYNNLVLSPITKNKFFMKLYSNLKKIYKHVLKTTDLDKQIIITPLKNKVETYLEDNKFTSKEITQSIINKLKYGYSITFENNTIIYFSPEKKLEPIIPKNIKELCIIIKTLKILFNRSDKDQHLTYFSLPNKKELPLKNIENEKKKNKSLELGPHECNSGLTYINLGHIVIYRQEEFLKVLIHEMIHANHIDEHLRTSEMSKKFCVNYEVLLNETFTETFANLLNIFFINIRLNGSKKDLNVLYKNEVKYSIYIYSRILDYYKINSVYDFIKSKKDNTCKTIFPQKTNVMAYYLLKNILLIQNYDFSKYLEKSPDLSGVFRKLPLPSVSPADPHPGYSISKDQRDGDIQALLGSAEKGNQLEKIIFDHMYLLDNNRLQIKKKDSNKSLRLTLYELFI